MSQWAKPEERLTFYKKQAFGKQVGPRNKKYPFLKKVELLFCDDPKEMFSAGALCGVEEPNIDETKCGLDPLTLHKFVGWEDCANLFVTFQWVPIDFVKIFCYNKQWYKSCFEHPEVTNQFHTRFTTSFKYATSFDDIPQIHLMTSDLETKDMISELKTEFELSRRNRDIYMKKVRTILKTGSAQNEVAIPSFGHLDSALAGNGAHVPCGSKFHPLVFAELIKNLFQKDLLITFTAPFEVCCHVFAILENKFWENEDFETLEAMRAADIFGDGKVLIQGVEHIVPQDNPFKAIYTMANRHAFEAFRTFTAQLNQEEVAQLKREEPPQTQPEEEEPTPPITPSPSLDVMAAPVAKRKKRGA